MAIEGELAQLVERCDRTAEVRGSSPLFSIHHSGPAQRPSPVAKAPRQHQPPHSAPMNWSSDAETSLREIPFVVRPIIRRRIETMAREAGLDGVDLAFYEQAKERFGRK
jgi:hypothetical protein